MTQLQANSNFHGIGKRQLIVVSLCLLMVLLFISFLIMSLGATFFIAALISIPILAISYYLLRCEHGQRYIKMGISMFALGGIGMLMGCNIDLGPLGLYGLLSLCQAIPLELTGEGLSGLGLEQYWQKMQLSPWTYIGMFLGGNLAMLLINGQCRAAQSKGQNLFLVLVVCNVGMLLGMLLSEVFISNIVAIPHQIVAAGLMVLTMLLTMTIGMLLALWLLDRFGGFNKQVFS